MPVSRLVPLSCRLGLRLKSMGCLKLAERFTLSDFAYAHRGLWTPAGPSENSIEACLAAAAAGLGIEVDLRPSADGVPMLFHDDTLDRMTDESGLFETYSASALEAIALRGTGQIATLETLLAHWPGDTPLLCEMKIDGKTDPAEFARTVAAMLDNHSGPAAAMSFSRRAVAALPGGLMRGQHVGARMKVGEQVFRQKLAAINAASADFIGCHTGDAEPVRVHADRLDLPVIAWTVKDAETSQRLKSIVDAQIFEGFEPSIVKPG